MRALSRFQTAALLVTPMFATASAIAGSVPRAGSVSTDTVSIGSASVAEGNSGAARAVAVRVTLATPATSTVSVTATLSPGTATAGTKSPADYKPWSKAKTLTFKSGQTAKSVTVSVIPDTTGEGDETAIITLSDPSSGLSLGASTGTVTIIDDDTHPASTNTASVGSASVAEGDSGAVRGVAVRVTLASPATSTVSVTATLSPGTATAGTKSPADYKPWSKAKTLTFTSGQTAKSVTVSVIPDTTGEDDETAIITLSGPSSGLALGTSTGTVTILDDDGGSSTGSCPTANFPDLSGSAGAGSGYAKPAVSVTCTSNVLMVSSNGMPSYTFVPKTPNPLRAQSWNWIVPLQPEVASSPTSVSTWFGTVGFTVTGLPIYAGMEGAQPANEAFGDPVYNGIVDTCDGHTGPAGEYHDHALNVSSACGFTSDQIVGYALDGFPIYGPNGCLDLACTQVVTFKSGWVRTGNPTTNAWSNYTYVSSDDQTVLDQCNGRIGPDGTYRYYATSTFPYTFGCFKGTPMTQLQSAGAASAASRQQ